MSTSHRTVKTLISDFYVKKRKVPSMFLCRQKPDKINPFLIEGENEKRIDCGHFGPLIVIHKEYNIKNKNNKAKNQSKKKY